MGNTPAKKVDQAESGEYIVGNVLEWWFPTAGPFVFLLVRKVFFFLPSKFYYEIVSIAKLLLPVKLILRLTNSQQ